MLQNRVPGLEGVTTYPGADGTISGIGFTSSRGDLFQGQTPSTLSGVTASLRQLPLIPGVHPTGSESVTGQLARPQLPFLPEPGGSQGGIGAGTSGGNTDPTGVNAVSGLDPGALGLGLGVAGIAAGGIPGLVGSGVGLGLTGAQAAVSGIPSDLSINSVNPDGTISSIPGVVQSSINIPGIPGLTPGFSIPTAVGPSQHGNQMNVLGNNTPAFQAQRQGEITSQSPRISGPDADPAPVNAVPSAVTATVSNDPSDAGPTSDAAASGVGQSAGAPAGETGGETGGQPGISGEGDGGGGAGGGDGGSVICTLFRDKGIENHRTWLATARFGAKVDDDIYAGYLRWAAPLVAYLRQHPTAWRLFYRVFGRAIRAGIAEMAHREGVRKRGSRLGAVILAVALPICRRLGRGRHVRRRVTATA